MIIRYNENTKRFEAESNFSERAALKGAGFWWDPKVKIWYTANAKLAAKLIAHADEETSERLREYVGAHEAAIEASRAKDAEIDVPIPAGLELLPYQRAGIAVGLSRPNVLIGDEMGLGKTIQAIGIINADPSIRSALVVCPASLRINWNREIAKWITRPMTIAVVESKSEFPTADIVIINYDILDKFRDELRARAWDVLVADECHYMKNPKTKRTVAVLGKWTRKVEDRVAPIEARRKVFLTGTPITNRPIELWPIVHALDPETFRSWYYFATRYCGAVQDRFGMDVKGASNLGELQEKLRATILVRRLKADVLTELPPKRRQVIEIPANGSSSLVEAEREAWERNESRMIELKADVELAKASDDPEVYKAAVARLRDGVMAGFNEIAKLRHDTAVAKIPHVIEHLENTDGKVVVFAHHKDVVRAIMEHFGSSAVKLTGDDPMSARQESVDRFQNDASVRFFVGSITAAGVGITLTSSAHVVFAELDWVPANVSQAEDRCHRIGQKNSVTVQHIVLDGSLDARMAKIIVRKQEVIDKALDAEIEHEIEIPVDVAPESTTRKQIEVEAVAMTDEQVAAVHAGLRMLSAFCDGAHSLDGAGFSKIDVCIGHSLARSPKLSPKQAVIGRRIVKKYRRQLPDEILEKAVS